MSLLGNLTVGILGNMNGLNDTFKNAQSQVQNFGKSMENVGRDIASIGTSLTGLVTVPIAAIGVTSAKAAIDFESAFAGVRKTVDATEKEFAEFEKGIRNMAKEIPAAATEIAAVAESAGQLGIKKEALLGFTRTMVDLGVATNMTSEQAANDLARLANITNMPQENFDRLGSSIVALGNNFATTESEITAMALRLAGAGAQVGMSEADILGLATALSSVGIEAEMGGSAISRVMVQMQMATTTGFNSVQKLSKQTGLSLRDLQLMSVNNSKEFKGLADSLGMTATEMKAIVNAGVDLEGFANIAGMTAEQFKTAFEKDAVGALGAFINGLGNASEVGDSAINMLQEMGISEIRLRDSLLRAGNANELFADAVRLSNEAWRENTALTNEAEQRYKTTESQLQILKNKLVDIGITLGQAILPVINNLITYSQPLIDMIANLAEKFGSLDPVIQTVIIAIAAIAAAIGPILVTLGLMITSVGSLTTAFGSIGLAITEAGGALGILTGPIGIAVAAIAGLGVALVTLWNESETFRASVTEIWESIKTTAMNVFGTISTFVQEKLGAIKTFWDQNGGQFLAAVENVFNGIKAVIEFIMPAIKLVVELAWTAINQVIDGALNVIMGLIKTFSGLFTGDFSKMWEGIKDIFKGAIDLIIGIMSLTFVGGLKTLLTNFAKLGVNLIKGLADGIVNLFKSFTTTGSNLAKGMVNAVVNFFKNLATSSSLIFNSIKSTGSSIWNAIKTTIVNIAKIIWDLVVSHFKNMLNAIKNVFSTVKEVVTNIWNGVMDFFKGIDLFNIGKNIIQGLVNGIGSMASAVWEKAKSIAKGIGDSIKKVLDIHSPSRVTTKDGEFAGQGLAVGLDKSSKQVSKSAKNIASTVDKEFSKTMQQIVKQADSAAAGTKKSTEKIKKSFNEAFNAVQHQYKTGKFNATQYVDALNQVGSNYAKTADQQRKIAETILKAEKNLVEEKKKLDKESFDHSKSFIDAKKQANELSLADELAAWERVHDRYKKGSEERIEAEKNIQRVRQEIYDQLLQANDAFLKKTQEINKNVEDEEKRLNEVYEKAVEERTKSIRDFAGLFDEVVFKAEKTGEDLLANLRGQVSYIDAWSRSIEALAQRGIDEGLLEELRQMGPKAMPELMALNQLTDSQLFEYEQLWKAKTKQAREIAVKELSGLRTDTDKQISELHKKAASQLEDVRKEFEKKVKSIRQNTETQFNAMKSTMPQIGRQAMDGLLSGLESMRGPLMSTARSIANQIASTIQKALDIHSPSRVAIWLMEMFGAGMVKGLDNSLDDITRMSSKLANAVIPEFPSTDIGLKYKRNEGSNQSNGKGVLGGFIQNVTINSPSPTSPSENARKLYQAGVQMGIEWGIT
ncbi:phage tail tape measure protein [Heyndrickxia oleronia]|uniref:phage tail tape measure protein n=1 Tax=Heyndrickxia oleronia TaxID=38875 RepID=UPI001C0F181A|nr:phage tail tape measure protein [Heyndrickxia oleronia]MBU5214558.1 phage tail tape measure protein [Heyndrickxia oleronia]